MIVISIPQPCHEQWEEMLPMEQGRYCQNCAKQVIDFSGMSDAEVIDFVQQHGMVCGRFAKSQLDREMRVPRKRTFMPAALLAGFLITLLPGKGKAQTAKADTVMTPLQQDATKTHTVLDDIQQPAVRDSSFQMMMGGVATGVKINIPYKKKSSWWRRLFVP